MPWFGFLVLQNERGAEILSAKAKFSQAFQTWTEFGPSPLQQKTGGQTAALPVRRVLMGYCSRFWGGPQGSLQFLCNFFAFPLFLSFRRRFATGFAKISSLWLHVFPFPLTGPQSPTDAARKLCFVLYGSIPTGLRCPVFAARGGARLHKPERCASFASLLLPQAALGSAAPYRGSGPLTAPSGFTLRGCFH